MLAANSKPLKFADVHVTRSAGKTYDFINVFLLKQDTEVIVALFRQSEPKNITTSSDSISTARLVFIRIRFSRKFEAGMLLSCSYITRV